MRCLAVLAALLGVASAAPSIGIRAKHGWTVARPGTIKNVVVTKENTLNGTYNGPKTTVKPPKAAAGLDSRALNGSLPLELVNNFGGGAVNAYIVGLDSDNHVVFVRGDGSLVYPSSGGSQVPVPITEKVAIPLPGKGQTLRMTLPIVMTSGRIYFAEGSLAFSVVSTPTGDGLVQPAPTNLEDPSAGTNWGFVELTYTADRSLWANISYVDFVGMILSMALSVTDGGGTQITRGLGAGSVGAICNGLGSQADSDGWPWDRMCVANAQGTPLRVLSPNDYAVISPGDFGSYWSGYVDKVWQHYASANLTVDTQANAGRVSCGVSGSTLTCAGDNRGYAKPSAGDIWGCNGGPFLLQGGDNPVHVAVVPRLCAAFVRSTLLLDGGDVQPGLSDSSYYTVDPTNHYSRLVHAHEVDGRGYAFAYDDVNPSGHEDSSGLVHSGAPDTLTVYVGAPPP
ncbi:glycoside hydrolase family 64 [Purpureocillium lavendulum]|uniref:Glycoside hydrolase family 64 n=1 Tax=Purpureocillium lavendulum TaxID=1247861 RepID=A0AB34FPQ2_9HYPO|nr:glycoside hydrolase family 64 [Purpureocillium lavendulum]